ncbi:MAG: FAD-dependent oxidoreductase [Planctomycetota bacterium]
MTAGSPPRRAFVLGGGVAGMAAAFGLADRGFRVELIESRAHCGGRAFATPDRVLGRRVDNGFHVMLGCYRATRALLRRLGTEDGFQQDPRLVMQYRFSPKRSARLSLSGLPVPLAMPWALLRLGISWSGRLRALFGMSTVLFGARKTDMFSDWLQRRWQRGEPDDVMWRPLCRAVMNCEPEEASARAFLRTLREAFFGSAKSAAFWIPTRTWGEIFADPAPAALEAAHVRLRLGSRVAGLQAADCGARIGALELASGERISVGENDLVASALPWFGLRRLLVDDIRGDGDHASPSRATLPPSSPPGWAELESAPIVTAYFECKDTGQIPPDEGPVVALVGAAPFHFLLRTPGDPIGRFALLSGGDRSLDGHSVAEIARVARQQLANAYGVALDDAVVRIRKEQHATFVASPASENQRPRPGLLDPRWGNLYVCGDWTDTGFPATLEGAARSAERMLDAMGVDAAPTE